MRVLWLAYRDLSLELRGRTGILSVVFFLAVMLLILGLAFGPQAEPLKKAGPGVLWVSLAFAGSLLASRAFGLEVEDGTLDDLLLTSGSKEWIYLGKFLFQLLLLLGVGVVLLLLVGGLFQLSFPWPPMLLTLVLGAIGYAAVSTFYAGLLARLRGKEVLLPLLLFPIVVPVILAAVRATVFLSEGYPIDQVATWWQLLAVFDLIFVTVCTLLFPYILEG